jgi:RimJ/RimL family protein N-acetyltransferase
MKIEIKKFNKEHLNDSRLWLNNKELSRLFCRRYQVITEKWQKNWFKKVSKDKTQLIFAIIIDGIYVGNVGLKHIDKVNRKAEYYIFIGREGYRGKGIGAKSSRLLIKYIKNNLPLKKIYLHVAIYNSRAIRLYEKLGFIKEGLLRKEIYLNNKSVDMIRMAYFIK